ncbi:MAG: NupC/NupG family nucleoside CNT transporter [Gemmatimonadota bacterium]|jgi:CNT family concentrative nucleoside transporter|nr:MAG: NupC/NupG family nucleoside CNT transporter [Gemmatimonadota bacterium]
MLWALILAAATVCIHGQPAEARAHRPAGPPALTTLAAPTTLAASELAPSSELVLPLAPQEEDAGKADALKGITGPDRTLSIAEPFGVRLLRGCLGLAFLLFMAWLFTANRGRVNWALIGKGLLLQVVFGFIVLRTTWGRSFFRVVNDVVVALIGYTNEGAAFLFGQLVSREVPVSGGEGVVEISANFAFSVLPTIIFFSSLMAILYFLGVMQKVVKGVAWAMQRTLKTSGAETLSAAGNIFVGQTEAPLLIRPFVARMTMSELNTVMTGGFATVAGGVMAAYVAMLSGYFPDIAGHLLAASIMAAPAGIVISKLLLPETEEPETRGTLDFQVEETHVNVIDAAAGGAAAGLKLALNVGAMLLAFLALIALGNGILGWVTGHFGLADITLERLLGYIFAPVAWLIGVPWSDAETIGSLFGIKMVANEFVAFQTLADLLRGGAGLSEKSIIIATYALTGFANFASIAIQIGGIGGIAPERRHDLSRLGLRAMLGGTAATWMTATLAGVLA